MSVAEFAIAISAATEYVAIGVLCHLALVGLLESEIDAIICAAFWPMGMPAALAFAGITWMAERRARRRLLPRARVVRRRS